MKTTHRDYSDVAGDFNQLCLFLTAQNAYLRKHSTWSLGRFVDWKYGLYENRLAVAAFWDKNAHLWFDRFGELAGIAISENGDAGFAVLTAEGYRFLFEEILGWACEHWGERAPGLNIEVTEHQAREIGILERFGFGRASAFYTRRFDLTQELAGRSSLEPGFTIVDMHTHPDYREQRLMRADGFGGKPSLTEEELRNQLEFYNNTHASPIYHAPTDLCVMAPDSTFVAGCEALIDARNAEADIERVCTRANFRKRGFARAVIQECLYRLREMGLRNAYITGYSPEAIALYGSLGAVGEMTSFTYERAEGA